jgi:hypothetical protein
MTGGQLLYIRDTINIRDDSSSRDKIMDVISSSTTRISRNSATVVKPTTSSKDANNIRDTGSRRNPLPTLVTVSYTAAETIGN